MNKRSAATLLTACLGLAGPTTAEQSAWVYGDWQVLIDREETDEDLRVTCVIQTRNDAFRLYAEIANGDALPPDRFPLVFLEEVMPQPGLAEGEPQFAISVEIDQAQETVADPFVYQENARKPVTGYTLNDGDDADFLRAMRNGDIISYRSLPPGGVPGQAFAENSLAGFAASYLKMAEQCGFPSAKL